MRGTGKKVFWGIYFVLSAILMIVLKVTELPSDSGWGFSFWGILCTVFLVALIIKSIFDRSIAGILFPVALIAIVYDDQLGITAITPWYVLGAALLGSIGLSMIFHPKKKYQNWNGNWNQSWNPNGDMNSHGTSQGGGTTENVTGSNSYFKTTFGEGIKYVKTEDFRSCDISNSFGETKVFFDGCSILEGVEPTIHVSNSFGEIQLYVPKNWNVSFEARASFGAVEEKNRSMTPGAPIVHLQGSASFGAVEVFYV